MAKKKRLFCEINPFCYALSLKKEIIKRHVKDLTSGEKFTKKGTTELLPVVLSSYRSHMIKRGPGIDPVLQENKVVNIKLAVSKINGTIIHPGEAFSFWRTVGKATKRRGYREGRVILKNKLIAGTGGGLCNLGNTIHLLVLHSPLDVTEFHSHSDALAPDEGKRVPFSTGTSVSYNNIDYRVKNNTDRDIQIHLWCDGDDLCGELRSVEQFPWSYRLVEEGHHFRPEGEKYYRVSKIYRETLKRDTDEVIDRKLVLDNHSEVMFDYSLIPTEQIKETM